MKRARRLEAMPPYPYSGWSGSIAAAVRSGRDLIRLDIGNPDLPPPGGVVDALCASAHDPAHHGYPGYRGLPALRQAMADYYQRRFGVDLDPERQVVPLIGSKEGIYHLALAYLDPGDMVLVPNPGYAAYTLSAALAGAGVHTFPLLPERDYLPDLAAIPPGVASRAALIWLNYPNNPTGATADLDFFAGAVAFARRNGLLLCHDAPYCDVGYDGYAAPSLLQVPGAAGVAVEFNSLSKTANMAGWRLGMAVGNAGVLEALAHVKSNFDSGIFRPLQEAAIQALAVDPAWIARRNAVYQQRLEIVLAALARLGIDARRPRASLYLWVAVPAGWTSATFALALLQDTGVALSPGTFFGPAGEGYVRLSVTAPTERLREAMARLEQWLAAQPACTSPPTVV
jgi:LL-diaminopimelate aminotransferase